MTTLKVTALLFSHLAAGFVFQRLSSKQEPYCIYPAAFETAGFVARR